MTDLQIYSILLAIMFLGFGFLIGFVYAYRLLVNTKEVKVKKHLNMPISRNPTRK